ncbi:MAG: alginate lyase family protein, partial [Planctomycetaceae bacterium]|nr:alginate lyase family protein [Planctomycetaceae bacterium]
PHIGPNNLIWNAFPIATRASWWVRSLQLLQQHQIAFPADLTNRWQQSLLRQAHFLSRHLEWDLRGNHILRDAVGLAWVGRYFTGRRPDRWLRLATSIAESQASEQVLPDGAHFERSPMYHIHVMEDFLSLAALLPAGRAADRMRATCAAMSEFTSWMRHPDGSLPLFNDAAQHAVCDAAAMLQLTNTASDVPQGLKHFADAGVVAWRGDPWSVFWDIGDVGPGYQPGHAHADTLTFECSYQGQRLIVDPGTFSYDRDDRRRYDRSTAAHNTVCVDDRDSSEVWHIFRVGRRAKPIAVDVVSHANGFNGYAAHTGYNNLPGQPRHGRRVSVAAQRELRIVDQVDGRGSHRLSGGYLIAPEWTITPQDNGWRLECGHRAIDIVLDGRHPLTLSIETQPWHPEYGLEIEAQRLVWRCETALPAEIITLIRPAA